MRPNVPESPEPLLSIKDRLASGRPHPMALPIVHPFLMGLLRRCTNLEGLAPSLSEDQAWERIIREATDQGLMPPLYRWLKTSNSGYMLPTPTIDQIKEHVLGVAARNVLLAQELTSILRAFAERQVPCVPLRGLALAESFYGDSMARPMGDIDLLVHKEDLPRVAAILKELGFQEFDHRPGFAQAFSYTLEFFKYRHGWVIVEPHWTIAYPPFADRVNMEMVWRRCVWGQVIGVDTWLLGRADLVLHLCFHLIHQGKSAPLLWFYELDRLLRQGTTAPDWTEVVSLTRETGLELFVAEVLGKVKILFDSPIPDHVLSPLRAQPLLHSAWEVKKSLENRIVGLLTNASPLQGPEEFAMLFTIKGLRAKVRYAFALLFPSPQFMLLRYGLSSRRQLALCYLSRFSRLSWEGLKDIVGLFRSFPSGRQASGR